LQRHLLKELFFTLHMAKILRYCLLKTQEKPGEYQVARESSNGLFIEGAWVNASNRWNLKDRSVGLINSGHSKANE
jgi:hypothetical protein